MKKEGTVVIMDNSVYLYIIFIRLMSEKLHGIVVQELADNLFCCTGHILIQAQRLIWGSYFEKRQNENVRGNVFTAYVIGWTKKHKHGIV